jgi:NitT/TauT family transport system substrate-binding protein
LTVDPKAENVATLKRLVKSRSEDNIFKFRNSGWIVKRYNWFMMLFSVALVLFTSACGSVTSTGSSSSSSDPSSVVIAYQPGLASASLVVIKQRKTLESQFPHTNIQWKIFQSGAAVREAMIANQAQVGYMGIPPYMVGWDRGVNWGILTTLSRQDSWLVVKNPKITSLKDFTSGDKVGMPAPDSLQSIVLRKAAQEQLGNAHALDNNIVSIPQADGVQALITGQLAGHLTSPPFEFQEVAAGGHAIVKSFDIFGQISSDAVVVLKNFYNQYPAFARKLYQDIQDATAFVTGNPDQTAQYLSQEQAGKPSAVQFKTWLQEPSVVYNLTPFGLVNYASFMQSIGLISKVPNSVQAFELPILNGAGS